MKKIYFLLLLVSIFPLCDYAQHSFSFGNNSLELGGYIITSYNRRFSFGANDPNANDHHKNTLAFDDARFSIKGWVKGKVEYNLEVNFADLAVLAINGLKDAKNNPLLQANVTYNTPYINICAGYMKMPFSASYAVRKINSPFQQRATVAGGDYFSKRDVGLLLFKDFWNQRITVYAGVYSGMGEQILLGGDNDQLGKPEYMGRIELSSQRYRDHELDMTNLPIPIVRVGANIRYNEKGTFTGSGADGYAIDNVKTIDGKKLTYGVDAGFMWHGFSAQFEWDESRMQPHNNTPLATQLKAYNTTYFRNGGFLVQANYYSRLLMSAFAVRYDDFNPSDLTEGDNQRTLSFAYNFILSRYNITLKAQYWYRLKQESTNMKWDEDQLRFGAQYIF